MKTSKEASIRRCQPAQRAQRLAIPPDRIEEPARFDRRADRAKVQLQKLLEAPLVVWVVVGWFGLGRLFGDENAKTRLSRCEHYRRSQYPNCARMAATRRTRSAIWRSSMTATRERHTVQPNQV